MDKKDKISKAIKNKRILNIFHDLKTPIAMAETAIYMCRKGLEQNNIEKAREAQRIALSNVIKVRKDIGNMLHLFILLLDKDALMPGRIPIQRIALRPLLAKMINDVKPIIEEKKLSVVFKVAAPAEKIPMRYRDAEVLFGNLLDNAVKFTKRGAICINAKAGDKSCIVEIKDTGCGINRKDKPRLFKQFCKPNPSAKGLGLGLSLCKEIVNIYKGKINILSPGEGRGTRVIVELPF